MLRFQDCQKAHWFRHKEFYKVCAESLAERPGEIPIAKIEKKMVHLIWLIHGMPDYAVYLLKKYVYQKGQGLRGCMEFEFDKFEIFSLRSVSLGSSPWRRRCSVPCPEHLRFSMRLEKKYVGDNDTEGGSRARSSVCENSGRLHAFHGEREQAKFVAQHEPCWKQEGFICIALTSMVSSIATWAGLDLDPEQ